MVPHALPIDLADADADADGAGQLDVLGVQRTCVHDGPGIRTAVFFRGCRMRCLWCHNPEAQPFGGAASDTRRPVAQILDEIRRDREYFATTHGGVTLSGGEPLLQRRESLLGLLAALRADGIPVAVETAVDAPWATIQACMPFVDLFLVDLKAAGDDAQHLRLTSRRLAPVHENIRRLVAAGANVRFRMCVVPGHNDAEPGIAAVAALLRELRRPSIELLRYHDLYERKARRLHVAQEPLRISSGNALEALERAARAFEAHGIAVSLASRHAGRPPVQFTPRVRELHRAIREAGHHVCIESARLKTEFYKRHGFDAPVPIHRARALRHVLNHKSIAVHPRELLVGNFTSKRVGGNAWVEYFGTTMAVHFWKIDRQTPVSFTCSASDKARFYGELLPFWARHSLVAKAFASFRELALSAARTFDKRAGFNNNMAAIAHFVVNCERVLSLGTTGMAREVEAKLARSTGTQSEHFEGTLIALRALEELADRYASRLRTLAGEEPEAGRREELRAMADVCARVPKHPARTFQEALQSILFLQIALCTESFENAISLGRLDAILRPYYEADLAAGRLDYESAKELLACFVLKFDEVVFLNDGDSAFQMGKLFESLSPVETVTMGGIGPDGEDVTNDVTYMLLDVCELRPIGVNMAARIHRGSPSRYLERIAEVYLGGSPMPALYNDEVYVPALRRRYDAGLASARNYSIVGCVEPVASDDHFANTDCANVNVVLPFLQALVGDTRCLWRYGALGHADETILRAAGARIGRGAAWRALAGAMGRLRGHAPPASLEQLMARFQSRLDELVAAILADHQGIERALARDFHTPLASSLFPGCIESGKDVYEGGATINSSGIQAVGVTDVADSLLALEEVVYRKRLHTIDEVIRAIECDFEGEESQRIRDRLLAVPKFGDDASPAAHVWVNRVLQAYVSALDAAKHPSRNGRYVAGYYGLNVNMVYGKKTPSLPSGRLRGTPLANSICPHYGMQSADLTSSLNAVAQVDFAAYAPNGTTLTSTIDAGLFPGEEGVRNLAGVIRGFFNQGGMQFQPNLVSRELLLDAYRNPGKHKNLVVRIAGYCAYFDDLSDELKKEIIGRTYYAGTAGPTPVVASE
jgi:formate C-acetyltransferase